MEHLFKNSRLYNVDRASISSCKSGVDVVLVLNTEDDLPETHVFLEKVMKAANRDQSSYELKFCSGDESLGDFFQMEKLQFLIFFGIRPSNFDLQFHPKAYQPYEIRGKKIVFSGGIAWMKDRAEDKKKLWEAMKKMFDLPSTGQ
ncbi:MAG TPA: hypothetical protein DEO99_01265 [Bacteroidetes bacterium]|nr:hypothetical protein [Bacteroidota bacterium]